MRLKSHPPTMGSATGAALEFRGKLGHSILVLPGDKWREDLRLNSTISLVKSESSGALPRSSI
jgi:hypothetical protein